MPRRKIARARTVRSFAAMALLSLTSVAAWSQVDCVEPRIITTSRIEARVFDYSGAPISGAKVTISSEKAADTLVTDARGAFSFSGPEAKYGIQVHMNGFAPLEFQVRILKASSERRILALLVAGQSYTNPTCPWATTSHREFKHLIKEFQEEPTEHATPQ
jgi:hypothetical protein